MCKLRSVHTGQVRRSRSDTGKKMTDKNFKLEEEKKGKERITEEYFHTEMFHVKQSAVEQRFEEQLVAFGIRLSDMQKKQFLTYYKNLVLWNQVMNLTAITDMEEVYTKHFVDSLSFIKAISGQAMPEGSRLIDVGTGAGFPGLPLAIVYPGLQVTLMDSLNKRIRFLDDTVEQLGLANIRTVHARAEELARNKQHREQYLPQVQTNPDCQTRSRYQNHQTRPVQNHLNHQPYRYIHHHTNFQQNHCCPSRDNRKNYHYRSLVRIWGLSIRMF